MKSFGRFAVNLPLFLLASVAVLLAAVSIAVVDLFWFLFGRSRVRPERQPDARAASVVIPNWNGRDLLEKYLPSVIEALSDDAANEVVVVDNGSEDGSADFVAERFPTVKLVRLQQNEGFGGGSNAGFRAAKNDIVVLLNSDMRVDRHFLQPLLDGFTDPHVFAVSCQIFFSDPDKPRQETGLTQGWWENGALRVRHRIDEQVRDLFPCFYGGGGSCAFDRQKFLELGGFDELLKPFYLEDTDLGYLAWKRGWKVLYQPKSIVYHEHRGTIGKKFSQAYIDRVLKKNFALFCWKNIHEWHRLSGHFTYSIADSFVTLVFGDSPERTNAPGLLRATLQLPQALRSRWRARSLASVGDTEAFRRPLGGYYLDRFETFERNPERLSVLFVSPYPICPPTHGGGVFMYQTCRELARLCRLHLLVLIDFEDQRAPHDELVAECASAEFLLRVTGQTHAFGSGLPHAVNEFASHEVTWAIHRQIYQHKVDVLQIEYTPLAQYAEHFRQIPSILFEHDIYFQSIGRQLPNMSGVLRKAQASFEYLRALRYELKSLPGMDRVQVCSRENADHLLSFLPGLRGRIDDNLRAGIDTRTYEPRFEGREPNTMLFLGGFRHLPNQEALQWFTRDVLPLILQRLPDAKLVVVGADPPPRHSLPNLPPAVELRGFVEDVHEPLRRYALFVCPILSGSGIRVKLLEAFASGIPVVSTRVGAEGLALEDGQVCGLADDAQGFAERAIELLSDGVKARDMAVRARKHVEATRDMKTITALLERSYRAAVMEKRSSSGRPQSDLSAAQPSGQRHG